MKKKITYLKRNIDSKRGRENTFNMPFLLIKKSLIFLLVLFSILGSNSLGWSQNSVTQPSGSGSTGYNGNEDWSNPNQITISDNSFASINNNQQSTSDYLQGRNFGFNIPTDATIIGIVVNIDKYSEDHWLGLRNRDDVVSLIKGGTITGSNYASATQWPVTEQTATYGGSTDLWGTTWTPAEINSTNFGIALSVYNNRIAGQLMAYVDYIQITVYYCLPAGNPADFGNNTWNVYGYNGSSLDLIGVSYCGYYTEPEVSFDSRDRWGDLTSPSSASGYQGCPVNVDNHTVRYKRTGFASGTYQIDVTGHDDEARLYIDGANVWEHNPGCCDAHTAVWSGTLNPSSTIEFRVQEGGGESYGALMIFKPADVYNSTTTVTIPSCANAVTVYAWGAGGGGTTNGGAGGGGGGGAFTKGTITELTPGNTLTVTVGTGGGAGSAGGSSSVQTIVANGGSSGINTRNGGPGGTASLITGFVTASFAGGEGGDGSRNTNNDAGGGGGGSAYMNGPGGAGGNGGNSNTAGGTGGSGTGNGGNGAAADNDPAPQAGNSPGGGGGGRGEDGGTSASGADGRVILVWQYSDPVAPSVSIAITAGSNPSCAGNSVTFTATPTNGGSAPTYQWKVNGNNAGTGATYTTTSLANNDIVSCVMTSNDPCAYPSQATSNSIQMTVYPGFTAGAINTTGQTICSGGDPDNISSSTAASGGDGSITYQWQSSTDGVSFPTNIASSNAADYNPPANLTTTTWYRRQAHDGTCNPAWATSTGVWKVTVVADPVMPTEAIVDRNNLCSDDAGNISLSVTGGSGAELVWYSTNCGTGLVGSGSPLSIASPATTTTYYARWEAPPCSASGCASVEVNVEGLHTITLTSAAGTDDQTVCQNSNIVPITYDLGGGATSYSLPGGLPAGINLEFISHTITLTGYPTDAVHSPYTFSIVTTSPNNYCPGVTATINLTVNPLPGDKTLTAEASAVCSGLGTNIQVALSESGAFYQLRNDADNSTIGSPVAGNGGTINLPTGNLTVATTFNVLATVGTCQLEMTNTPTVSIHELPTFTLGTVTDPSCNGGSDGKIAIHIDDVTDSSPYYFSINNGSDLYGQTYTGSFADYEITNLTAGNKYIRIKDKYGCESEVECP